MSHAETGVAPERGPARSTRVLGLQAVLVVVLLLGAGLLAGVVWAEVWDPPVGVVRSGTWLTGETGLRAEFAGTALYVVVALVAGLTAGVLAGLLLARSELLTLAVLLLASVAAALVMRHVGLAQSPPDPRSLAPDAPDGTPLPGALTLAGRVPLVSLPLGALVGYTLLLLLVPSRRVRPDPSPALPE